MDKDKECKSPAGNDFQPRPQISPRRLWLFRIIAATVFPVLVLVLLEVTLHVAGYGFPPSAFVKYQLKGRTVYCSNNKFGWRFFPPRISREFEPFAVPADKPDNTYRIFIFGESAAQGDPDPSYSFGRQLSVMLHQQYPSVNFEVVIVAMAAINSHVIVRIAEDCAQLKPDLFVVYMGNNEVIGPYGPGTVFSSFLKSSFLIRTGIITKATKLGQLITSITDITGDSPKKWGGRRMFVGKQIRYDDKRMEYVYSHFRQNLEDIIRISQRSGAKTIVSTVAVNLKDCPPFASLHRLDLGEKAKQFDSIYRHGIEFEKARDFNRAIDSYTAAAGIDDTYAELYFRMGRCQWNLEQYDKAKQNYVRAMDLDGMCFRADSRINQIIREVSAGKTGQGVYFVDAADEFARQSPHNCPGFELFLEHVHLNFHGNYQLAKLLFNQVKHILPDRITTQKIEASEPNETDCARLLAYTDYDNLRITKGNFSNISTEAAIFNQAYRDETIEFWRQKTERIEGGIGPGTFADATEQYKQEIELNSADRYLRWNYAKLLGRDTNLAPLVVEQYRRVVELMPYDYRSLGALATWEIETGNIDSALNHALKALEFNSTSSIANYTAGLLYEKKGEYQKAQKYVTTAMKLSPTSVYIYKSLASILEKQGKIDQVEQIYRRGIEAVPADASLHLNLALLLQKKGQLEEAEKERRRAKSLNPNIVSSPISAPGPTK
jgi:tetratricopeptide (TPR) repeat protein